MFEDFNFDILNDPEFKEDSVREELIVPIIKELGYKASGESRIIRGKNLIDPYVAIGSRKRKVSIVPDYVFLINNEPYWVLEAKSPNEDIIKSKHTEQAYSYAIHPEIRAKIFSLCNGKEFVIYSIDKFEPILQFPVQNINKYWDMVFRILHPDIKANPELVNFYPDYGMHLKQLGLSDDFTFKCTGVHSNFIGKVEDGLYTTTTVYTADRDYVLSLDFGENELSKLLCILPANLRNILENGLKRQPYSVSLDGDEFKFGVISKLSSKIIYNAEETYLPFHVSMFMDYQEINDNKSQL